MNKPQETLLALIAGAALAAGCSGDDVTGRTDVTPPSITFVSPVNGGNVTTERPPFVIEVTDGGSGIFCTSVQATIDGRDYSGAFRNGCDEDLEEVNVSPSTINPPLIGPSHTLNFKISDFAGNQATGSIFFSFSPAPPPPAPPS